jgi:hypothetical protein
VASHRQVDSRERWMAEADSREADSPDSPAALDSQDARSNHNGCYTGSLARLSTLHTHLVVEGIQAADIPAAAHSQRPKMGSLPSHFAARKGRRPGTDRTVVAAGRTDRNGIRRDQRRHPELRRALACHCPKLSLPHSRSARLHRLRCKCNCLQTDSSRGVVVVQVPTSMGLLRHCRKDLSLACCPGEEELGCSSGRWNGMAGRRRRSHEY